MSTEPAVRGPSAAEATSSPRERILATAAELFYKQGIRAVGVDAIVEHAGTNKMTLYRHFSSKDELVAEYLRREAVAADKVWGELAARHPHDPLAQLRSWFRRMSEHVEADERRGCALANAAVELPEADHPARAVIRDHKTAMRDRIIKLARAAALTEPKMLADELFLLLEGARVTAQSVGREGFGARLVRMGEAMIAAHRAAEVS